MIDPKTLEAFYWVVKLGGFGRAAERLHMTQPAISSRISQIEARFSVRLLDRSSHRAPVPTPKGLELFAYAARLLSLQSELTACLAGEAGFEGTIRLGTAETLVHTMLGSLVRELNRVYPRVTPEITVDISPNLQQALLQGEIDVALLLGPVTGPQARNIPLVDYELIFVASPGLGLGPAPLSLAGLVQWPVLSYARGTKPHADIAALFQSPEMPHVRIFGNASLTSIARMAVDGIGIGILPAEIVTREIAEGTLVRLETEAKLPPLHFTASYLAAPGNGLAQAVAGLAGTVALA